MQYSAAKRSTKKSTSERGGDTIKLLTIFVVISLIIIAIPGGESKEINSVIITSEKPGSSIRLYAKENTTSYIYETITIHIFTNSNNSTALIYFNSMLKDSLNFSYTIVKTYTVNDTTKSISIIVNNKTHKFYVNVLRNINLDNYIQNRREHLKYTEQQLKEIIQQVKLSMLEKVTVGFLIGFIAVSIYMIRRLRNEIQPIL